MTTIGWVGLALLWALDRACELMQTSSLAVFMPLQLVFQVLLTLAMGSSAISKSLEIGGILIVGVAIAGLLIGLVVKSRRPIEHTSTQQG